MKYSKLAHAQNSSGFFFDHDNSAPADAVDVAYADYLTAVNLPAGSTYDFDSTGRLTTAAPSAAFLLQEAQEAQIGYLQAEFESAISAPVPYLNTAFQCDDKSQTRIAQSLSAGSVPSGFFWVDAYNNEIPMTFQQLQGLSLAILVQTQTAFANLQVKKAEVRSAKTVSDVKLIIW